MKIKLILCGIVLLLLLSAPVLGLDIPPKWYENRTFEVYTLGGMWYDNMKVVGIVGYAGATMIEFEDQDDKNIKIIIPVHSINSMVVENKEH